MASIMDGRPPCAAVIVALALAGSGCVLAPKGIEDERAGLRAAGQPFEPATGERRLPELSPQPDWREVLRLAFLSNGDLQAAYFEWKAALARVAVEAAYPNTNVSLGFQYLFSDESMKSWDRTTLNVGFDPMQNLWFPSKVVVSGRAALEAARAAGKRFAAAKFELQRQVQIGHHRGLGDARIDHDDGRVRVRAQSPAQDRVVLGDVRANEHDHVGAFEILVGPWRSIAAE